MQQLDGHFAVDEVVVGQQHPRAAMAPAQPGFGIRAIAQQGAVRSGGGHDAVAALQHGREPERAALPRRAGGPGVSAHQLRQTPGNRQAQAGAAVLARGRGVGLLEGLEQPIELLGRNADAGVFDFEAHQQALAAVFKHPGAQRNATLVGELDRVTGIVEQTLAQPGRVTAQPQWHAVAVDFEPQPFVARRLADDGRHVVENRVEVKVAALELQPAGLDLGQVQDVVDDGHQVASGAVDLVEPLGLFGRGAGAPQQVIEADDGVHRGSDLVAHVGQKGTLGAVRAVGLFPRGEQFSGALTHHVFEMVAVLLKLGAQAFFLGHIFLHGDVVGDAPVGLMQRLDVC